MTCRFSESTVEDAALAWLGSIGWRVARGTGLQPYHTQYVE
jgi:hypothetical protein